MSPKDQVLVTEDLETWAKKLVDIALQTHMNQCPIRPRVERLELRLWSLIAFMAGSGVLGGIAGGLIAGTYH